MSNKAKFPVGMYEPHKSWKWTLLGTPKMFSKWSGASAEMILNLKILNNFIILSWAVSLQLSYSVSIRESSILVGLIQSLAASGWALNSIIF